MNKISHLVFVATSIAALSVTAYARQCNKGACAHVASDPCWVIVSQKCLATPGVPSYTAGPAVSAGPGDVVDCDACRLNEGEGGVQVAVGQETGLKFCISLGVGVELSAGASVCGVGISGSVSANVATKICVDAKRWVEHTIMCRCAAGTLVHCRTEAEMVPIAIAVPVSYNLSTCYARRPSVSEQCDLPADGTTSFTQIIYCGTVVKTATDTRMRIRAAFADGICSVPIGTDLPIE